MDYDRSEWGASVRCFNSVASALLSHALDSGSITHTRQDEHGELVLQESPVRAALATTEGLERLRGEDIITAHTAQKESTIQLGCSG